MLVKVNRVELSIQLCLGCDKEETLATATIHLPLKCAPTLGRHTAMALRYNDAHLLVKQFGMAVRLELMQQYLLRI